MNVMQSWCQWGTLVMCIWPAVEQYLWLVLVYGHPCLASHSCFTWKSSSKFWELRLQFCWPSGWGVSLWTCSWSCWQKPTCYIQRISVSHVPRFWLASLLPVAQHWSLFTRDSLLVNYFHKINVSIFFHVSSLNVLITTENSDTPWQLCIVRTINVTMTF